jgi:outer membrane protein TolC
MGRSTLTTATALATSVCFAIAALAPDPAHGEDAQPDAEAGDSRPGPPEHEPVSGVYPLSLTDAIAVGLTNNLEVEVERYAPLLLEQDRDAAWGAYDPEIFGDLGYETIEQPVASSLQEGSSVATRSTGGAGGFRGLLPYLGASYGVTLSGEKTKTTQSIQTLSPELTSNLTISGSIPLLKGLLWNEPWTAVKTTQNLYESSVENFRIQVMEIVQRIANSYWFLVAQKDQLRVAQRSVETARALLDQVETQYEVGVVSKVDVVEAEAGVAERDFDLIVADNAYRNAQDRLIDIVLGPYLTGSATLTFQPTDDPESYTVFEVDADEAVDEAFSKRPELEVVRKTIERNEIQQRFAKNQRLPQFDVNLSYGFSGLAGEENDDRLTFGSSEPIEIDDDFDDTFDDYFRGRGADQFTARGVFSIPFPNTTARKRAVRAELELRRSKTRVVQQEQAIILEVRAAVRGLRSALRGIEAAERRRVASEEQVRAERVRLEHGESTPFDVLQRERDLTEAESQKIFALQRYRESVTALDRSRGTILEARNVEIEAVRARPLKPY